MRKNVGLICAAIIILAGFIGIAGCSSGEQVGTATTGGKGQVVTTPPSHSPLTIRTSLPKAPLVNEDIILSYVVYSPVDISNVSVEVILRHVMQSYSSLSPVFNLASKQEYKSSTVIKIPELGLWTVETFARSRTGEKVVWAAIDVIHLNVGTNNSSFGWPHGPVEVQQTKSGNGVPSSNDEIPAKNLPIPPAISPDRTNK